MGLYPSAVIFSTIHIGHYYLLCNPSSIKKKCAFQKHALLIIVLLYLFLCRIHQSLLCLLWSSHICYLFLSLYLLLCYCYQTVPLEVFYLLTSKILQFLLLLPPHFYFLLYTIPHYSTCQHLKLIMGNRPFFFHLPPFPAVTGQVPEPFATKTLSFFSFFQFCP